MYNQMEFVIIVCVSVADAENKSNIIKGQFLTSQSNDLKKLILKYVIYSNEFNFNHYKLF